MTDKPLLPTRIIPPGAALPGETPPWHQAPPPPPPTAPAPLPDPQPRTVEVRHVHEILLTSPDPDPEPDPSRWERAGQWIGRYVRSWHAVLGLTGAVIPIPGVGYSAATVWHYTVGLSRTEWGVGWGYALGGIPLALAVTATARRGGSPLRLFALAVTGIGALAALSWYDPVQWITGVTR